MTVPAGNVRPSTYHTGTVAPASTSGDIGPGSSNTVFVITFVALSFVLGAPGDIGYCHHSSQPIAVVKVLPSDLVPVVTAENVETTLDDNFAHLEVVNNGSTVLNYLIAGYFWCPEPARI